MKDPIVKTKDGRTHRVLWPTKFDSDKKPTHYRVKPAEGRSRGSYEIKVKDIV